MKLITRFAVAMIVAILFISAGGTAIASAQAIPGDTLYPVKTLLEDVKLNLTLNDTSRQQFEERLQETRREEILAVIQAGRIVDVQYWGELTAINENNWEVGGLIINLDANTQIIGEPVLGSYVVVKAITQEDGTILAYMLIVKGPYTGDSSSFPGPQGTDAQMWMQNHERVREGTHEPANNPMPDHDPDQDHNRDRTQDQSCDQTQDPACEPNHDQDRDRTHDQTCDQAQDMTCDPDQDQDRDRTQDKTNEPTQDQNRDQDHDQDCEPPQEPPHSQPKPGHGGGH